MLYLSGSFRWTGATSVCGHGGIEARSGNGGSLDSKGSCCADEFGHIEVVQYNILCESVVLNM